MNAASSVSPSPAFSGAVSLDRLLEDQPPVLDVGANLDQVQQGRRIVVLDDDPTGTQSIADLPVLTSWSVADLQWALQQPTTAFFILTNTRSLTEEDAAERNRQIVDALDEAAALEQVPYVILQPQRLDDAWLLPARDRRPGRGARRARDRRRRRGDRPRLRRARPGHRRLRALDPDQRRNDPGLAQRVRQGRELRLLQLRSARLGRGEDRRPDQPRRRRHHHA